MFSLSLYLDLLSLYLFILHTVYVTGCCLSYLKHCLNCQVVDGKTDFDSWEVSLSSEVCEGHWSSELCLIFGLHFLTVVTIHLGIPSSILMFALLLFQNLILIKNWNKKTLTLHTIYIYHDLLSWYIPWFIVDIFYTFTVLCHRFCLSYLKYCLNYHVVDGMMDFDSWQVSLSS